MDPTSHESLSTVSYLCIKIYPQCEKVNINDLNVSVVDRALHWLIQYFVGRKVREGNPIFSVGK